MAHYSTTSDGHSPGAGSPALENQDAIAIVGMACRFPQEAENSEKFWSLLLNARSALAEFPATKFNVDAHYHPDPAHGGTMSCRRAHFLRDSGHAFDAPFFNISKTEAMSMDPQQRLLMENVYEALENAGISIDTVSGSATSVFVGAFTNDFQTILNDDPEAPAKYAPTGNSNSILSNRVSWFYDLKGCSLTMDTACSSSLVAVHLACENLRSGAAEMSIVGGVNVIEQPQALYRMSKLGFLSPDGKCYSFDHRANGYSRGEGVGVLVMKPLRKALQNGDTIRAVIRGSGVNQDGRTPGMTLPSKAAQETLIRSVYDAAGLNLSDTDYVEAHGTGTAQGDPVEAEAIAAAWSGRLSSTPLYVGAVKTNIGHLEGASGVAGVIKTVLALESATIPPNINFEEVNPKLSPEKWNIKFPLEPTPWPDTDVRRASINSFGFGGTNAHIVLDDAYNFLRLQHLQGVHRTARSSPNAADLPLPETAKVTTSQQGGDDEAGDDHVRKGESGLVNGNGHAHPVNGNNVNGHAPNGNGGPLHSDSGATHQESEAKPRIFFFSSSDQIGLKRIGDTYSKYLTGLPKPVDDTYLGDLAYTLVAKRSVFPWRSAVVASSRESLVKCLPGSSKSARQVRRDATARLGFVFTGQGAQWAGMGRDLLQYPVFRSSLDDASAYLHKLGCSWDLIGELLKDSENSRLDDPEMSQTVCTALQVALVDLLRSWAISPVRVVGHSSGEIAAAYAAASLSRTSAWRVAYYRGVVSARLAEQGGAMLAAALSEPELSPYFDKVNSELGGVLTVACYNSPRNLTLSGHENKIDRLVELLGADKVFCKKLNVRNAYHSEYMKAVAAEYEELIGDISEPARETTESVTMVSSVTGAEIPHHRLQTAQYWVSNLLSPVRFSDSLRAMCSSSSSGKKKKLRVDRGAADMSLHHLVEIGPHSALQSAISDTLAQVAGLAKIEYHTILKRGMPATESALSTVAKLFCSGYPVDVLTLNHASQHADGDGAAAAPQMLIDLPPYPFNHSQTYWPESRLSKNFRSRTHPRLDLLGAPVVDWNINDPRWRQILRVSENPWMKDHRVTGKIVYPGVGYIIMAIEASKQLHEAQQAKVTGYRLRDISIRAALQVPETDDGVEVMLSMPPATESSLGDSSVWRQFKITSYSPNTNGWIEHCRGLVMAELETSSDPLGSGDVGDGPITREGDEADGVDERFTLPVDMARAYTELDTIGLSFGPLFKNLSQVRRSNGSGEAVGHITVPDVAQVMPKNFIRPHIIHPTTMDSMIHLFLAAVQDKNGGGRVTEPMVPIAIREVWVASTLDSSPGCVFRGHGTALKIAHKKFRGCISVRGQQSGDEPLVHFRDIDFVPLQSSIASQKRQIGFNMEWRLDMDLVDRGLSEEYLQASVKPTKLEMADVYRMAEALNLASILYVLEALKELGDIDVDSLPPHAQRYLGWMRHQAECFRQGKVLHQRAEWQLVMKNSSLRSKLLAEVEKTGPEGRLTNRMGASIVPVLRQEADALQLMFGDDLLDSYYRELHGTERIHQLFRSYLELHSHKQANLKVLEIGAGTGGTTLPALEALCPEDGFPRVAEYVYTDISPGFFEKAKSKFKSYLHVLEFRRLDIEKDPLAQGYEEGHFDIAIASNVLHATVDIANTLGNVRKLLKTGGVLLLQEAVNPQMLSGSLAFGTLPGWWLGNEESRRLWPILDESQWDDSLRGAGFGGTHFVLKDHGDQNIHAQSLMVAKVPDPARHSPAESTQIANTSVVVIPSPDNPSLTAEIEKKLRLRGVHDIRIVDADKRWEAMDVKESICIALRDLETSTFKDIGDDDFNAIRKLLTTCRGLLWVTGNMTSNPDLAISAGLMRSLRWERDLDDSNLVTISFDQPGADMAKQIAKLFDYHFLQPNNNQRQAEYRVDGASVLINRLVNAPYLDEYLCAKLNSPPAVAQALGAAPDRALTLSTDGPGQLNRLQFVDCRVHPTPLEPHDVEVAMAATGLNFRDVMSAMGEVAGDVLGAEGAGTVSRVGSAVRPDHVAVGDRVALLASRTGCFSTFARTVDAAVVRLPDSVSFEEAAGFPVVATTVYYALVNLGRLARGESVLIHAAAGGVGQAAVMLATHLGAEIFATVSTREKKALLVETYGIPEDHVLYSRDVSFGKDIMRLTGNRGVDVVLNSLAGEALRVSWNCVAPFGRFIEIGKRDIYSNGRLEMFPFSKNITFASCDLETVMQLDQALMARLLQESMKLWEQGVFRKTTPLNVFPFSKIESSFRLLQQGRHIGKVVLTAGKEDIVPVVPRPLPEYRFPQDATYVLAGGLGGLGRSTAKWMASRGARHFIFLSRTGGESEAAQEVLAELQEGGCKTAVFACDVSDAEALQRVIRECGTSMPPIRGCIQGAMQLRDAALETMNCDGFTAALRPKVHGSFNLHTALPPDMDFFIMVSSICGLIGNRGQSNYAAGNTYQDALAHFRRRRGQAASAIDLGSMLSVGFIAEHADTVNPYALAAETIREEEFHAILEHHVDPRYRDAPAQVAVGLANRAAFAKKGIPEPSFLRHPLFALMQSSAAGLEAADGEDEAFAALRAALRAAKTVAEATSLVVEMLVKRLSSVMSLAEDDIDSSRPVHVYGVDSLVAVEFRNWLAKNLEAEVEVLDIMGDGSIAQLSEKIVLSSKLTTFVEASSDETAAT